MPLLQHIAMALRFGDWKRGYMAVTCYFDASGNTSEVAVIPATLVASPEQWVKFYEEWDRCLAFHQIPMLHARNFANFRKDFRLWDLPRWKMLLNDLLWIIEDHTAYTAASAVLIEDYKLVDRQYKVSETMRPYTMGCLTSASSVVRWADKEGIDMREIIWVFERGDQDQNDLKRHWDIAYPDMSVEPIFLKKRDKYPDPNKIRWIRPFEAADLIAYEHLAIHRLLDEKDGENVFIDEASRAMQRMLEWPSAKDWNVCDQEGILSVCEKWRIPKRLRAI